MTWSIIDDYLGPSRYLRFAGEQFDMEQLKIDQNYLKITPKDSLTAKDIFLYTLDKECFECPYTFLDKDVTNVTQTNLEFRIATKYVEHFPQRDTEGVICDLDPHFGQHGVYNINVNSTSCEIDVLKNPVNIYSPVVTVFMIYLAIFGVIYGMLTLYKRLTKPKLVIQRQDDMNQEKEENKPSAKSRVHSLDTFRGIAIVIMIFANYGDGGYLVIRHTPWNGLHLADLVFPWFMWIMGACIPISLNSAFTKGVPNRTLVFRVLKRSAKLFLLGLFIGGSCNFYNMRIFGVLQRFAVCYFAVFVICIYFIKRHVFIEEKSKLKYFEDFLKLYMGWIIVISLVVIHTVLIFTVTENGCPRGYLGPGGLHKNGSYEKCIGGASGYIDRLILGKRHLYQNPTIYAIFGSKPFDPEGIVGCLTSIFQVYIGVHAGTVLLVYKKHSDRLLRWLIWSVVTGIIGGGLCGFSKENGVIPVNKNLWSLSFVMVTSCFAFVLLSFCYVLIDIKKWWSGKPFLFAGMNAIILYVGHEICYNNFPVRWYYYDEDDSNWRKTHFMSFLSDTWGAGMWVLFSYYLYKIKYFFTV